MELISNEEFEKLLNTDTIERYRLIPSNVIGVNDRVSFMLYDKRDKSRAYHITIIYEDNGLGEYMPYTDYVIQINIQKVGYHQKNDVSYSRTVRGREIVFIGDHPYAFNIIWR